MTNTNSDSENQTTKAISFLRAIGPRRPVASIDPETGGIVVRTLKTPHDAREWILPRNGTKNLYYTINPTKKPMERKPKESDIAEGQFHHVEADPMEGESAEAARKRHRAAFKSGVVPMPTLIYDSGNGVVALWKLETPVPFTDAASIEEFKAVNKALALALGGKAKGYDTCYSVDHLLRLPYTTNLPDARKRKAGRQTEQAGNVEHFRDNAYSEFDFPAVEAPPIVPGRAIGPAEPVESLDELRLPDHVRALVEEPHEEGGKYDSRSERDFAGIVGMVRNQVPPEQVLGVLTSGEWPIGERLRERDDPDEAARKEVERALAKCSAADPAADFPADLPKAKAFERFKALKLSEVMASPDPKWLINGILAENALFEVFGQFKAGKTFFGLEMALCIATGHDFFDCKTTQGRVVYVIAEGNKKLFGYRVTQWIKERAGGDKKTFERLSAAVESNFSILPVAVHMDMPKEVEAFLAANPGKFAAIFIDTLMRNLAGDPMKPADLVKFMAGCDMLRDKTGAAVVFFHHMRRENGTGGYGPIIGEAFADGTALVFRKGNARHFKLHVVRDGDDSVPAWVCEIQPRDVLLSMSEDGEDSRTTAALVYLGRSESNTEDDSFKVLDALHRNTPKNLADLVTACKLPKRTVQRHLATLRKEGLVLGGKGVLKISPFGVQRLENGTDECAK